MKIPFRCPVCEGRQMLPYGFYELYAQSTTNISAEICRTCGGTGIVWGEDDDEIYFKNPDNVSTT